MQLNPGLIFYVSSVVYNLERIQCVCWLCKCRISFWCSWWSRSKTKWKYQSREGAALVGQDPRLDANDCNHCKSGKWQENDWLEACMDFLLIFFVFHGGKGSQMAGKWLIRNMYGFFIIIFFMFSMVAKAPTVGAFTCCIFFPRNCCVFSPSRREQRVEVAWSLE